MKLKQHTPNAPKESYRGRETVIGGRAPLGTHAVVQSRDGKRRYAINHNGQVIRIPDDHP